MKIQHSFLLVITVLLLLITPNTTDAAVNLPWSTTYNCPEWKQTDGNPNCDGLAYYGGWTTTDNKEEQITSAANYLGGAGGRGQRHWLGDPGTNGSGSTKIEWTSPQQELWIRWYMRFQSGFQWNPLQGYKIFYINVGLSTAVIPGFDWQDQIGIVVNGSPFLSSPGNGWNAIMANGGTDARGNKTSDGQWHLYELHMKMDTNGSNGVVEWWVDGVKRVDHANVNYGAHAGWSYMVIGENHAFSANGPVAYYVDYDDISINGIAATSGGNNSNSDSGSSDASISGGGCGFVKDIKGKGQGAKGKGLSMVVPFLLLILLMLRKIKIRYVRLYMRKLVGISLFGVLLLLNPSTSLAAINLPWSTTYNCPEWKQTDSYYTNCDGLTGYGGWKTNDGKEEQITSAANYPGGGGGRGQRHWLADGGANNSGSTKIEWTSPQKELWIRWYMRFQKGFQWNKLLGYKIFYINVGLSTAVIPGFDWQDQIGIVVNGNPFLSSPGNGWNAIMANGGTDARGNKTSDGQWHLYELHMKMDTNGGNGVVEWWVDGVKRLDRTDVNYRTHAGWSYMVIGENGGRCENGSAYYVDYDDIVISTTGPIGPLLPIDKK